MSAEKPRRLGRGLEALIGSVGVTPAAGDNDLQQIPIGRVRPNPYQPRREFHAGELAELEASLKASGLIQPITVRRSGDAYELIAGERRLRAATNLGWTEIAAIVREFDERTMLVLALVENLQRSNLNAIEEARGYRRLIDDFSLTQQQVADAVGKDRTTVTNLLRLLSLPEDVQRMVENGSLSSGHARALLALASPDSVVELARSAAAAGWSVRELEQRVRDSNAPAEPAKVADRSEPAANRTQPSRSSDPAVRRVEDDLRRYLQTDVRLHLSDAAAGKGKLEIAFYSHDDLDRLLELILREQRRDF